MKYLLMLFLIYTLQAKESCYTVQLLSKHTSKKNKELLTRNSYDESCQLMNLGKSLTVRCGCFNKMKGAKELLPKLRKEYPTAYITSTYKSRFQHKENTPLLKSTPMKKIAPEVVPKSENCYSVQLLSKQTTEKNRELLTQTKYPPSCKLIELHNSLTIRCGCYEHIKKARESLPDFRADYADAYIVTTKTKHFIGEEKTPLNTPLETIEKKKSSTIMPVPVENKVTVKPIAPAVVAPIVTPVITKHSTVTPQQTEAKKELNMLPNKKATKVKKKKKHKKKKHKKKHKKKKHKKKHKKKKKKKYKLIPIQQ